jgi:phosphate transport system permease protein
MTTTYDQLHDPADGRDLPVPFEIRIDRPRPDRVFRGLARTFGFGSLVVLVLIGVFLLIRALPAFRAMGWAFFTTTGFVTNGAHPRFGVLAELYGTVVIAVIALVFAIPVSLAAAMCINEYLPERVFGRIPLRGFFTGLVDLMAAVPSVIYALWGFFILQPRMAGLARWLSVHMAFLPFFRVSTPLYTSSAFIAGGLVGIMVMPIITSLSREVMSLTPRGEREAAMSLGAGRSKVIRRVVLPFAKGGVVGAVMLGLGRALGDTIAVAIIISPVYVISSHVLQAGSGSIAALIAERFGAGGSLGLSALLACGLVLFVITLLVNLIASWIVDRSRNRSPRTAA